MNAPCEKSDIRESELKEHKKKLLELCIDSNGRKREVLPDSVTLIELEFAIFGGLSWKSEYGRRDTYAAHKTRLKDFNRLCKTSCKKLNIRFRNVPFYFLDEPSRAGEWHVHFLIAAKGIGTVSPADLAATLQTVWTERFCKGTAKIEPFDPKRQFEGVSYVCKISRDDWGNEIANFPVRSKALLNLIHEKSIGKHN